MGAIGILSFILSFAVFYSLRWLFPRNFVPLVSTSFDEAMGLLKRPEANSIPNASGYRERLALLRPEFLQMRTASHRSPWFFQQFYQFFLCGLTWRLYVLKSQVDDVTREIEVALDERERQLRFHTNTNAQSVTTALPASAADTVIPMTDVTEPTPPAQAVLSVRLPGYH